MTSPLENEQSETHEEPLASESIAEQIASTDNEAVVEPDEADFADEPEAVVIAPPPVSPAKAKPVRTFSPQTIKAISIGAVVLFLLVYLLRINGVVGLYVDDGWYLMLAKSLGTGQGYALLNSPTPGVLPLYPPGWPLLMSLFYRIYPHFPDNLWLLKLLSVASMFGAGWFTYLLFYQVRELPRLLSLLIALASVLTPALVYFATETLMSECLYMFLLMGVIYLVERNLQQQQLTKYFALAGLLGGYAFLVRSTGLALLAGIGLCLLLGKRFRPLVLFCVLAAAVTLPWMIYSRVNVPTPAMQAEQNTYIVQPYTKQFWQRVAGDDESGEIQLSDLPERVWNNVLQISIRDMARILIGQIADYLMFEEIKARGEAGDGQSVSFTTTSWMSFIPTIFILIGFIAILREKIRVAELVVLGSIVLTLLWPFEAIRFILPLIPFFLYYLIRGLRPLANIHKKLSEESSAQPGYGLAYVLVGFILLVNAVGNLLYTYQSLSGGQTPMPRQSEVFQEHKEIFQYVDETVPKDAIIAAANPPLTYMFTGRKTVGMGDPAKQWELWKKIGVSHMVFTSYTPLGPPDDAESRFRIAYKTNGRMNFRVLDLGPVADRKMWSY